MVILGAGESGVGAAILAQQQGYDVFVSDAGMIKENFKTALQQRHIDFEEQQHTEEKILNATEVMKSPGIPEKNELVKKIRYKGIPIISEIELAYHFCPGKIIAVTGSNGKTTTCHLLYRMLKAAGRPAVLCGNVGFSFLDALADIRKESAAFTTTFTCLSV